jgi:hypothetical protein
MRTVAVLVTVRPADRGSRASARVKSPADVGLVGHLCESFRGLAAALVLADVGTLGVV